MSTPPQARPWQQRAVKGLARLLVQDVASTSHPLSSESLRDVFLHEVAPAAAPTGPASALTALIGLRIAPHFNQPYAAETMASFWGSRWNLTASNTLRFLVYDPICEGAPPIGMLRPLMLTSASGANAEDWTKLCV